MKLKARFLFVLLALAGVAWVVSSCEDPVDPEGVFEFNIQAVVSGQDLVFGDTYEMPSGRKFKVEELKFFISDLVLIDENGLELELAEISFLDFKDDVFDAEKTQHGGGLYETFVVPTGNYRGVKFGLGVKPELNHFDPATWDPAHPLGVDNNMNWNWTAGYRNMVFECKLDSTPNMAGTDITYPLVWHPGSDTLYRVKEYQLPEHNFTIESGQELQFILEMDVNQLFDGMDVINDNITHTMPIGSPQYFVAEDVTENWAEKSLFKVPF